MENAAKTAKTEATDTLRLGHATDAPDGVYYVVAEWSAKARDYRDIPGLYSSEYDARAKRATMPVGARTVRYTVHQGSVTTRRGLR